MVRASSGLPGLTTLKAWPSMPSAGWIGIGDCSMRCAMRSTVQEAVSLLSRGVPSVIQVGQRWGEYTTDVI